MKWILNNTMVINNSLIQEGENILEEAEKTYNELIQTGSNRMNKWMDLGNLFQKSLNLLSSSSRDLTLITQKAIESYSKAAYIPKDPGDSMPLFAHAAYLSLYLLKQKNVIDLKKECLPYGKVYSFDSTLAGKTVELYLQAALNALSIAENYEIQNELKAAALFYGEAGDYYFSQYVALTILPKEHLFYNKLDQHSTLFKAGECYLKSVNLSRVHGIPSINYWIRQSNRYVVFSNFFDAEKQFDNSILDDKQKVKFIYTFLAKENNKYGIISKQRLRCIDELDEFVTITDEVNLFEKRMRDFIDKVMPDNSWMENLNKDVCKKIEDRKNNEKQFGIEVKRDVDYLEMLDYSKVIQKHWNSKFKSIFGDKNFQDICVLLKNMANVYRNPESHSRETTLNQRGHFNISAEWFYGYFDSI